MFDTIVRNIINVNFTADFVSIRNRFLFFLEKIMGCDLSGTLKSFVLI